VIRSFGRADMLSNVLRGALRLWITAFDRSSFYSLYPQPAMLSTLVMALLLNTREMFASGDSLGTLTAFILLFRRCFTPVTELGDQWQTVQSALAGANGFSVLRPVGSACLPH
jgi:ATP-binding cassette subfamily B protein